MIQNVKDVLKKRIKDVYHLSIAVSGIKKKNMLRGQERQWLVLLTISDPLDVSHYPVPSVGEPLPFFYRISAPSKKSLPAHSKKGPTPRSRSKGFLPAPDLSKKIRLPIIFFTGSGSL